MKEYVLGMILSEIKGLAGGKLMYDLHHHRVKLREPSVTGVMGFKELGMPPPPSRCAAMVLATDSHSV